MELCKEEDRPIVTLWQARRSAQGEPVEPVLSLFGPTLLATRVLKLGFTQVSDLGPEEADRAIARNAPMDSECTRICTL